MRAIRWAAVVGMATIQTACGQEPPAQSVRADTLPHAYQTIAPLGVDSNPGPGPSAPLPDSAARAQWLADDHSRIDIYASGPVVMMLTAPDGRRKGQAGVGAPTLEEIRDGEYVREGLSGPDGDTEPLLLLSFPEALPGRYLLQVYGERDGETSVEIRLTDLNEATVVIQIPPREIGKNQELAFEFEFVKAGPSPKVALERTPSPR